MNDNTTTSSSSSSSSSSLSDANAAHDQDDRMSVDSNDTAMDDDNNDDNAKTDTNTDYQLDCYPYTFTPLLLFAQDGYFDRGYSNYNAVAQFFASLMDCDMLENVLYERTNALYEDLYAQVLERRMTVISCVNAHFTALQVVSSPSSSSPAVVYYDPMSPHLQLVTGTQAVRDLILFLLLKNNYGDSQHVQDNKDNYYYYQSSSSSSSSYYSYGYNNSSIYSASSRSNSQHNSKTAIRKAIGYLWKDLHQSDHPPLSRCRAPLRLDRHVLINNRRAWTQVSTQLTSNTCYFQSYLFAVLCKVGGISIASDNASIEVTNVDVLAKKMVALSRFLLEFFVRDNVMRPLTNCNFILDFFRYKNAPYFRLITEYLKEQPTPLPDYRRQYELVHRYYHQTHRLHNYAKFTWEGAMPSTPNTKSLQMVRDTKDAAYKLARSNYYKYRAANLMFGFNAGIFRDLDSFAEFNALRKNQLLAFYEKLRPALAQSTKALERSQKATKYRDYYFMPQFEIGQQELVDVHHYTYMMDMCSLIDGFDSGLVTRVREGNKILVDHIYFSTQKTSNYDKMMPLEDFKSSKKFYRQFCDQFMTIDWLSAYVGLGFGEINPNEKEINSLTQTVFYSTSLMATQGNRMSYEFEKECINQMSRSNLRMYQRKVGADLDPRQKYRVNFKIGQGYTYSKYNTLFHFLNLVQEYWHNPDLSNIQVFGKDIRALLAVSCQKVFFQEGHSGFYYYGPIECSSGYSKEMDLAMANSVGHCTPVACMRKRKDGNDLIVTDRVFEYNYLRGKLDKLFSQAENIRFKSDNEILNLCLLSLMLDFGLYEKHVHLLNLPNLRCQHDADTKELQVEIANVIYEFDRQNRKDAVTRSKVEELLFEASYTFIVNKDFSIQSHQFKLIQTLNSDPDYQSYVLLVKIYMSLCQINRSVEVDYYKVFCDGEYRIIIPNKYSKKTADYLEEITKRYTFSIRDEILVYDEYPIFDLRPHQPEVDLHKLRFDSATDVQSMVKYIEISNTFKIIGCEDRYLIFMADNVLVLDASGMTTKIWINEIAVEVSCLFFNEALSFLPCFSYVEGKDVVLFASRSINYMVDQGGQFATDYYGMKHEIIECIESDEVYVDLNDEHVFKRFRLSDLLTESKTVLFYPNYLLQVPSRQVLMNLLDLATRLRNISFFIMVLFYLRRCSVFLKFIAKEGNVKKISGPWKEAILYVLDEASNSHYDKIFQNQFFDLNQHKFMPLEAFIEVLCENFTKYQRYTEDGEYLIVPRPKQKAFLKKIITAEECFHFSEVGSGKSKVIVPLLCQAFLSNNIEVHKHLARGGRQKSTLIILVPEHLVSDALGQVFRYCLNINFRANYRIYDDIFCLLSREVVLSGGKNDSKKQIFVTSFNQLKKALTYDQICKKVQPCRDQVLILADEVDDFLERDKLVFNICSNKSNSFGRSTLEHYFKISRAVFFGKNCPNEIESSGNPAYWKELYKKFNGIHSEIQDASRSINKSFGVFNEETLRHCSTNIMHDIEGYKSQIARPYESVNRAMPGSYYSDVERTIYLTYVILQSDISKYNDLFQAERKFISFEYWNEHFVHQLDFDDLVYGHEKLSEIVTKYPDTKDGLTRFLYEIILRRMEIRDRSRSVNSIDVIFNFDCIGFTGTPFLDNYPTYDYICHGRQDRIPDTIDRSFYAYTGDLLSQKNFEERFAKFQGQNNHVIVEYVPSDFIQSNYDEMATLKSIFAREEWSGILTPSKKEPTNTATAAYGFNAIVDLCGIFKRSSIHDVRNLIREHFGPDRFHYVYHIDQTDGSDRVLSINSENDVRYDEEFYKRLCNTYGDGLRDRIFFFIDNRNVIGKDIPFQLEFQKHFSKPLFSKSVVIAHDVDDFSRIWQAMGRSRTMNDTIFAVYKSGIKEGTVNEGVGADDIKGQLLTRLLYEKNCDSRMSGNISSNDLLLIALFNLAVGSFYYTDQIVNVFIDKMEGTIGSKVSNLEEQLSHYVLGSPVPAKILFHILEDKFKRSSDSIVSGEKLSEEMIGNILKQIVAQKFEQRRASGDKYDRFIAFLCGEQHSQMEVSYTKQKQKQKQTQKNKNQDSDAMGIFDTKNQLPLTFEVLDYFADTLQSDRDLPKKALQLPCPVPILKILYSNSDGERRAINVYPTLQFLYSHHIRGAYISSEVQKCFAGFQGDFDYHFVRFVDKVKDASIVESSSISGVAHFQVDVVNNFIKQSPQYTLAGIQEGVYLIGMKEQFNVHDLEHYSMGEKIQYVADEHGFVLFANTKSKQVNGFGPYGIEQYIIMETLSKPEIAQNVIEYYNKHPKILQKAVDTYDEKQGKGFVCWRFLMNETVKNAAMQTGTAKLSIEAAGKRNSPSTEKSESSSSPRIESLEGSDLASKKPRPTGIDAPAPSGPNEF